MDDDDRALCATAAAWLGASRPVAAWSLAMSAVAGAALALAALTGSSRLTVAAAVAGLVVCGLGLVERYYALRMRFDEGLFAAVARGEVADGSGLDRALAALHLRAAPGTLRTWPERVAGACALVRRHRVVVGVQTALAVAAIAWAF